MGAWIQRLLLVACACSFLAGCGGSTAVGGLTAPPAPLSLSVEPADGTTTVEWAAVVGASSYNLYWSETSPVSPQTAHRIANAVSPYRHTGLANGTLVYYVVTAVNAIGESAPSSMVGAMPVASAPAAPVTVNATPGDQSVTVDWTAVARADAYNLYWSSAPGPAPGADGVTEVEGIQGTSYAHLGLTNGTAYYYVITAVNAGGEGVASVQAQATPMPPAPGAPTHLTATGGDTQVQLAWAASSDAAAYNVYWSKSSAIAPGAAGVTQIAGVTTTAYTHGPLVNGDTYYYAVSAVGPGGESALSSEVSSRPLPPRPPAPQALTAIAPREDAQVTVQWYDVTDYPSAQAPIPLGYNLYRGQAPGLETYYRDPTRAAKFADVTAPFVDSNVTSGTDYYYLVTSFVPAFPDLESAPSNEVVADLTPGGGSDGAGGGAGGHNPGYGNNLSFPLVFADDRGLTGAKLTGAWPGVGPFAALPDFDFNTGLRPLSAGTLTVFPIFDGGTAVSMGGVTYYPQATPSTWQAEWRRNAAGAEIPASVDWGDALSSRHYTASSMVRIEVALVQDDTVATDPADTMLAYRMTRLSGYRNTEVQGTDGTTFASTGRTVFALNARLRIEKISDVAGTPDTVVFDRAIYESLGEGDEEGSHTEGSGDEGAGGGGPPLRFAAELNKAGQLIYGCNLALATVPLPADVPKVGRWRVTLALDPSATVGTDTLANHVRIVGTKDAKAVVAADGMSSSIVFDVQ